MKKSYFPASFVMLYVLLLSHTAPCAQEDIGHKLQVWVENAEDLSETDRLYRSLTSSGTGKWKSFQSMRPMSDSQATTISGRICLCKQ